MLVVKMMKIMKRLFSLLSALLLSSALAAQIHTDPRGWRFALYQGQASIIGHTTAASDWAGTMDVPASVSSGTASYPVTSVTGFRGYVGVTGLTLPATLQRIGGAAFRDCTGLVGALDLPESLTAIDYQAFYNCPGLTGSLLLPEGLTRLGSYAFAGCSGLDGQLGLPSTLRVIENAVFYGCRQLQGDINLPEGLTAIGAFAFNGCSSLTGALRIPEGVTRVNRGAFLGCSGLDGQLTLPQSLTYVGHTAFAHCQNLKGDVSLAPSVGTLGGYAFYNCQSLTGFRVQEGSQLTGVLPALVWAGCSALEYIDLLGLPASALSGVYFSRRKSTSQHPFFGVSAQTMVYLPTGADASRITASDSTLNYVLDGQCAWFSVMEAYDYELPHGFTALKATYDNTSTASQRTFSGTTAKTLYLPYAATLPAGMEAYTLGEGNMQKASSGSGTFVFQSQPSGQPLQPYTAYLVLVTDSQAKRLPTETNVYVPATPTAETLPAGTQPGDWLFCGTMERIGNAEAAAMGAYNLNNNLWRPITAANPSGYVNRFRCFLRPASSAAASVGVKSMAFFLPEADTATAVHAARAAWENGTARIHSLQGQYLGTDFGTLPQGLYLVEGQKVYKP